MARPRKTGLDYFPIDTTFDEKLESIEELHGNDGFTWIVKFWQSAYKTDDGIVDLSDIRGVIGAKKSRISSDKQNEIINDCIKLHLLYEVEPKKYTSNGIQKRIGKIKGDRNYDREYTKNKLSERKPTENLPIIPEIEIEREIETKNKTKENNNTHASASGDNDELFNTFWNAYPRKQGKGSAIKAWKKIKHQSETLEKITTALSWQKNSPDWKKDKGQYVPMPATYLNGMRWEDEPTKNNDDEKSGEGRRRVFLV